MDLANKEVVVDLDAAAFSSDDFRMFQFKVKRCPRARPHDWTQCPFAHPGEKAKRRDPRKYRYSGTACPEFRRNGCCRRGDACPFAHGVFECWLHPSRYRTQMCTDGSNCKRRVCFFAHTESELRKPDEDPLWFQQQIQQELAAEQHVQQQMQALKVFANILGSNSSTLGGGQQAGAGQQPGLDMLKNLPSSTLSQSLGALGQGAQAGHLQAGSGDGLLQLLQLVEQQQQQQQQASAAAVTAQQSPLAPAASAPANLASLLSAVTSATGPGGGLVGNGGSAAVGNGTSQDIQLKLAQQLLHQTQQSQQQQASGTLTQEGLQARLTAQLAGLSLQQQQQQQQAAKTAEAEAKQQQQQQAQLQANFALEFLNMLASQQQHVQAQQQQAVQLQQAQQQQAAQQQAAQQQLAQQQQHLAAAAAAALASASHQQAQQAAVAAQQQAANGAAASASSALAARQQLAALGIDLQAFGLSPDMLGAHLADAGGIPQAPSAAAAPDTMSLLAAALQGSFGGPNPTRKDCSQPSQNAQSQGGGGGTAQAAAASPSPSGMDPLTALLAAAAGQSGGMPGIPQAMLNSLQGMLGQLSMSSGSGAMMPAPQPLTTSPAVAQQPQPQQPLMQSASTSNPMVLPPLMERSSTSTASDPDGTPTSAPAPLASVASSCVPAGSEGSASSAPDSPPPVAPVTAPLQAQPQVPHMPSVSAQNNAALSALAAAVGAGGSTEGNAALATFLAVYNKPEMLLTAQSLIERMAGAASTGGIGANGMMDGAAMAAALAGVASSASAPSQPPASSGGGGSSATLSGAEDGGGALRALG